MRRISVWYVSTVFAFLALVICVYSLFSSEIATRTQAIYWFCIALASAVVPYLKDLAPYIKRVKVGDVEVDLNELKKEVQTVKNELDDLMTRLNRVSQQEASIPEEFREFRQEVFTNYAQHLGKLTPEDKLHKQEHFTTMHLRNASVDISELKVSLSQLGYYHGSMDQRFSLELAQAIEKFQSENVEDPPDGIAGPITLSTIDKLRRQK